METEDCNQSDDQTGLILEGGTFLVVENADGQMGTIIRVDPYKLFVTLNDEHLKEYRTQEQLLEEINKNAKLQKEKKEVEDKLKASEKACKELERRNELKQQVNHVNNRMEPVFKEKFEKLKMKGLRLQTVFRDKEVMMTAKIAELEKALDKEKNKNEKIEELEKGAKIENLEKALAEEKEKVKQLEKSLAVENDKFEKMKELGEALAKETHKNRKIAELEKALADLKDQNGKIKQTNKLMEEEMEKLEDKNDSLMDLVDKQKLELIAAAKETSTSDGGIKPNNYVLNGDIRIKLRKFINFANMLRRFSGFPDDDDKSTLCELLVPLEAHIRNLISAKACGFCEESKKFKSASPILKSLLSPVNDVLSSSCSPLSSFQHSEDPKTPITEDTTPISNYERPLSGKICPDTAAFTGVTASIIVRASPEYMKAGQSAVETNASTGMNGREKNKSRRGTKRGIEESGGNPFNNKKVRWFLPENSFDN